MKLLVTGANGQVGRELVKQGKQEVVGLGREALDITNRAAVRRAVEQHAPDVVVNAAAYTAVDRAEDEPERAHSVNCDGPAHLAEACADTGIPLVHISTDYVFDGERGSPYTERDAVNPLGVYGQSKWAGEEAVRKHLDRHVILRTSWVFGAYGANFVRTMLRLMRERDVVRVVDDQWGNPTAAADIAHAILQVARQIEQRDEVRWGTFHFAGQPAATWHGFAEAILEEARRHGSVRVESVEPIPTSAYSTAAPRPADSRLDCSRFAEIWGTEAPPWRPALRAVVSSLATQSSEP